MDKKDLKIFIALSRTLNKVNRLSAEVFKRHNLTTGQFAVLEALYHKGDKCVGEIQELILSTSGNMPVLIRNLETRGFVSTRPLESDRRSKLVSLTPEGREIIKKSFPENAQVMHDYFGRLSQEEKTTLLEILENFKE